jgi:threonine/homoserine/homoserine lactone efflux protein
MGAGYAFACVVQPGPFQAFLFSQSLTNGWRKTIPLVFAPLISDGPVICIVLFVLANVPHQFLQLLQFVGGVFLLYLAYGAYKSWRTFNLEEKLIAHGPRNVFKAVMVNFFNPYPYLFWSLVMGPLLIKGWIENPLNGIALLTGFYSTMIICSMGIVVLFAATRNLGPRVVKASVGISAIALLIFGIYQLWSAVMA